MPHDDPATPQPNDPARSAPAGESAGDTIGRYTLIEEIGSGGMGTVWLAEQAEPVQRRVALKIIKLGMDTREVVARFEAERRALALMDHPHIATVLDGGATAAGRPYFVMEHVEGTPITDYCDVQQLGLADRLTLFANTCEAIQHAHHKGLIHRDIKPSNILVCEQHGTAIPKVIDFGIAKATNAESAQHTALTEHAQLIGTPEYMSPEQAGMTDEDIDTRADVYSLGVLLYELLTGTKPFDADAAVQLGYVELLRQIREVDPARPSTRISSLGVQAAEIASRRRQPAAEKLQTQLRGELDWVVMKALEKDRARRYGTASGLATDVRRYLDHEPVLAAPQNASYRLRKFLRREKKAVAVAATMLLLLVAGTVGTAVGWLEARRANRALEAAMAATEARADELAKVSSFQSELLSAIDVERMGQQVHQLLIADAPEAQRAALESNLDGVDFTALARRTLEEQLFANALEEIELRFEDEPKVKARLFQDAASSLTNIGVVQRARAPQELALEIRRRELGSEHDDTVTSLAGLAALRNIEGRFEEAADLHREALDAVRGKFPGDIVRIAAPACGVAVNLLEQDRFVDAEVALDEVIAVHRKADPAVRMRSRAIRRILETHRGTAIAKQGRYAEAEPILLENARGLLDDADELPADHPFLQNASIQQSDPVRAAAEQVAQFYIAWHDAEPEAGHKKKALSWQKLVAERRARAVQRAQAVRQTKAARRSKARAQARSR